MNYPDHTVFPPPNRGRPRAALRRIIAMGLLSGLMLGLAIGLNPGKPVLAAGPFTVNILSDSHDSSSGDGLCLDGSGKCSLRAALEQANASGGATTINLPAGALTLSLGDLIVGAKANETITLHGTGSASTTIHQGQAGRTVFVVNPNANVNVVFNLDNVTVTGGSETEADPNGFGGNGGAILAGGSRTATGNSLNISNVVFTGNFCSPVSNAGCSGGAIAMVGGGSLAVSNSTFNANEAAKNAGTGYGGAIYFDNGANPGNVTITNSTFTNNIANSGGGQGGAVRLAGAAGTTFTLTNNTFTGNSAAQNGGALYLSQGSLAAAFNRMVGNVSGSGSGLFVANNTGSLATATNNWWGCNLGPGGAGCDTAVLGAGSGGGQTINPWIVLSLRASPNPTRLVNPSTLTASFLNNSAGAALTPAQVSCLAGLTVAWGSAVKGALSAQQLTIQASGTATAVFTPNALGAGSAAAQVDNATVTAGITITDKVYFMPMIRLN